MSRGGEDRHAYCLARDCARDAVVRKFVEPALELIILDKALRGEFDREKALLIFGEMYATAVAGDGSVGQRRVELAVGGELGGGAALLRLATLHLLNQLLPEDLKFYARIYVSEVYSIEAHGENAAKFMRLLAVSAPSAGGEHLSPKFDQFVEAAKVEVRVGNIRQIKRGVAADLIISEGGIEIKYNVYLRKDAIELQFQSKDRGRAELAAHLLRLVGVGAEVRKEGGRDAWHVYASTDMLAAGHEELRKALAKVVREAKENKWVNANTAERWLKKLERGRVLMEGWPKFHVRLSNTGGLEIRFGSPNPDSIEQVAQRFRNMGLVEGVHFSVEKPEGGKMGYVLIFKWGLARAAWLSVRGKDKQQRELAAEFVELILKRAEEEGNDVFEKVNEVIEWGKTWGSLTLKDFKRVVEVNGKTYVVEVKGGEAVEEKQNGRKLLRIKITAEMGYVKDGQIEDRVEREYTITFGRYGAENRVRSFTYVRADALGDREADAERYSALIEALTGKKPRIRRKSSGTIELVCDKEHLEGLRRFEELVETIEEWLVETSRR